MTDGCRGFGLDYLQAQPQTKFGISNYNSHCVLWPDMMLEIWLAYCTKLRRFQMAYPNGISSFCPVFDSYPKMLAECENTSMYPHRNPSVSHPRRSNRMNLQNLPSTVGWVGILNDVTLSEALFDWTEGKSFQQPITGKHMMIGRIFHSTTYRVR